MRRSEAGLARRVLAFADTNCDGTEAPMASDRSIRLRRDPKRIASRHRGSQSGWVLRVGDPVEVFDTDGWGPEGVWLRGTVFQLLPRGRYRVSCISGGMTDVSPDQIRSCAPAQAPIAA